MGLSESVGCWTKERNGEFQLIIAVTCFGLAFAAQRKVVTNQTKDELLGPLTFNATRYIVASCSLLCFQQIISMFNPTERPLEGKSDVDGDIEMKNDVTSEEGVSNGSQTISLYNKDAIYWGCVVGVSEFFASTLQMIGIVNCTAGKTAFITGLHVIVVPLIEACLPGGKIKHSTWTAACISVIGMYFVSGLSEESGKLMGGEYIILVSVLFWALAIMGSDRGVKSSNDGVTLVVIGFFATTVLALLSSLINEPQFWVYPFHAIRANLYIIVVVGLIEAIGYTFSTLGQTYTSSSRASLFLSLESVAGGICGYIFLHETLTVMELLGCMIMFSSFLVSSIEWDLNSLHSHIFSSHQYVAIGDATSDS